jgi:hypothetical protein
MCHLFNKDQIKEDEMGRTCSTYREKRNGGRIFGGKVRRK